MPELRENGPYIHPSWLPRLLIGMDHCEYKIWFQAHHYGRTWTKVASDLDSVAYNLRNTDLMKRCATEYDERGYTVTLENQNEFRIQLAGATVSGPMDVVATRDQELVIIDAKAARPSEAYAVQVMLYHDVPAAAGSPHPGHNGNQRDRIRTGTPGQVPDAGPRPHGATTRRPYCRRPRRSGVRGAHHPATGLAASRRGHPLEGQLHRLRGESFQRRWAVRHAPTAMVTHHRGNG